MNIIANLDTEFFLSGWRPTYKVKSLKCLCLRAFTQYCNSLSAKEFNIQPLQNIPNCVVQDVLNLVVDDSQLLPAKKEFFLLLLNKYVSQFNFRPFKCLDIDTLGFIHDCLIENCSELREIEFVEDKINLEDEVPSLRKLQPRDLCHWSNLRVAKCGDYALNDLMLKEMQINLHQLETFEFSLSSDGDLSLEGLWCFREMKNLTDIVANAMSSSNHNLISQIACLPPKLQRFGSNIFEDEDTSSLKIINRIGAELNPHKIITLINVTLMEVPFSWPINICVENLELISSPGMNFGEFVCETMATSGLKKIIFDSVLPNQIHVIFNKMGHGLLHMEIVTKKGSLRRFETDRLDLFKIFSATPNLRNFKFLAPFRLQGADPCAELIPEHFKQIVSFEILFLNGDGSQNAMKELFKLVLRGAENYSNLIIHTDADLEVTIELFKIQNQFVKNIQQFKVYNTLDLNQEKLFQVIAGIAMHSFDLRKIVLMNTNKDFQNANKKFLEFVVNMGIKTILR